MLQYRVAQILLPIVLIYACAVWILPFPQWRSVFIVLRSIVTERNIRFEQRSSMLIYVALDLLLLPVWATLWLIDEVAFAGYHKERIANPLFIISQPRSGTTFLLRTLSEDQRSFLSIKHLEWRYPYITLWKLIDLFGLRGRLERRSYWPDTEIGREAGKIHAHVLGNYEEFGIFLEERFYHHYFVFRRFPFSAVIDQVTRFDELPRKDKERMVATFLRVVQKVYHYRGAGETFLAKENENVEFCRAVIERLHDARVLMICRDPQPMLESYLTMSVICTEVKHGLNPVGRSGWHEKNVEFRRDQCRKFVKFWKEIESRRQAVMVSFADFTKDVLGTTQAIYRQLGLTMSDDFLRYLQSVQMKQGQRQAGYVNRSCQEPGFDFYGEFVRSVSRTKR